MQKIRQCDIFLCDFGSDNDGSEQQGVRPSLIVSNNLNNLYSELVIVIPITSKKKKDLPTHYILKKKDYNFFECKTNTVLTEQIRCVSKTKLQNKLGTISIEDFKNIVNKLNINFGEIKLYGEE
jgi:mRNA interferase MazF